MHVTLVALCAADGAAVAAALRPAASAAGDTLSAFVGRVHRYEPREAAAHVAYVSPANSLLYMDGGVDHAYSRTMWPGLEARVQAVGARDGAVSGANRRFMPVGSAFALRAQPAPGSPWLIVAPTMLVPQEVSGTRNAYWAARAIRAVAGATGVRELVLPLPCCGVGGMPAQEVGAQLARAWAEPPPRCTKQTTEGAPLFWVEPALTGAEQPRSWETAEFVP
jgi:O-acetyl-ADP-ribose deacetylase (regulator of RNase III)